MKRLAENTDSVLAAWAELLKHGILTEPQRQLLADLTGVISYRTDKSGAGGGALPQLVALLFSADDGADASNLAQAVSQVLADSPATRSALTADVTVIPSVKPGAAPSPEAAQAALPLLAAALLAGSPAAKESAASAMADIAATCDVSHSNNVAIGVLSPLVALLTGASDTAKAAAARALTAVSAIEADLQKRVVDAGAVPPLIDMLSTGSDATKVAAAKAIVAIASRSGAASCNDSIWGDAFLPLALLLSSGDEAAVEPAAQALAALAAGSNERRDLAIISGAVPLLVKLVKTEGSSTAAGAAMTVLAEVARGTAVHAALVAVAGAASAASHHVQYGSSKEFDARLAVSMQRTPGGSYDADMLPLFNVVLSSEFVSTAEKVHAACILADVLKGTGDTGRDKAVAAGVLPPLVGMVSNGNDDAAVQAARAICVIIDYSPGNVYYSGWMARLKRVRDAGAEAPLKALQQRPSASCRQWAGKALGELTISLSNYAS